MSSNHNNNMDLPRNHDMIAYARLAPLCGVCHKPLSLAQGFPARCGQGDCGAINLDALPRVVKPEPPPAPPVRRRRRPAQEAHYTPPANPAPVNPAPTNAGLALGGPELEGPALEALTRGAGPIMAAILVGTNTPPPWTQLAVHEAIPVQLVDVSGPSPRNIPDGYHNPQTTNTIDPELRSRIDRFERADYRDGGRSGRRSRSPHQLGEKSPPYGVGRHRMHEGFIPPHISTSNTEDHYRERGASRRHYDSPAYAPMSWMLGFLTPKVSPTYPSRTPFPPLLLDPEIKMEESEEGDRVKVETEEQNVAVKTEEGEDGSPIKNEPNEDVPMFKTEAEGKTRA